MTAVATATVAGLALAAGALSLASAAAANPAKTLVASAGALTAKLSYQGPSGATVRDERLQITQAGHEVYDQRVPSFDCLQSCAPNPPHPIQIARLSGDRGEDVILKLWTGGASCCTLDAVYLPSATTGSYTVDHHDFGAADAVVRDIGPHHRSEFVSADGAFACRFVACAESGLPLEVLELDAGRFVNVTRRYPVLLRADAQGWWRSYLAHVSSGQGLIAAWAADEDSLGRTAEVASTLGAQVSAGHLKPGFVAGLERYLEAHRYA